MNTLRSFSALSAATVFGAVALAAQTLLLRRFLWRFESAETGVALFLSCWLLWSGLGSAAAATPLGRRLSGVLARVLWLLVPACAALYFAQYALIENLRGWLGIPEYQSFPLAHLALGCLLANAPFCFAAGFVVPSVCRRLEQLGESVSRAFAWEALGAAAGGLGVTALLVCGVTPDPRDVTEWFRYFPQATERPERFETGGGTTFYGSHGGTFYALSSGGVSEVIPEGDRSMELAALILSQRPYAKEVLLAGQVPLAAGLALEALRPDLAVLWCPCDALYGVNLLRAAQAAGVQTRVQAAGTPPQQFLSGQPGAAFDVVLAAPPPATSLGGAAWREAAFASGVRRVTRRTGVALFGLNCEAAALTPEKAGLLDATVRGVRQAWPESGVLAAGAGGWWLSAQVPRLAYGAEDATNRFALLKRAAFPAEAVWRLYDPSRAQQWMREVPALDPAVALLLPEDARPEEILTLGQAEAVRRAYPETTPGRWVAWVREHDGVRMGELLLVLLWMLPVALGGRAHAPRRLAAAWLAACGALGLVVSLAVLYRVQMRFGSLYLLAGAGNCLYLAGLFCGNRLGAVALRCAKERPRAVSALLLAFTLAQAGVAFGVLAGSAWLVTATGVVLLCFAAGTAAGVAVPSALALCEGSRADGATVFALADALGAAVAGLFFVALVPLAGLRETVACFAALACGLALCAALGSRHARLTAGLALLATLAVLGRHARDVWPERTQAYGGEAAREADALQTQVSSSAPQIKEKQASQLRGIPRKVDLSVILEQMRSGRLSTNAAAFWERDGR
jgi:hypothetical protein